MLNLTTSLLRPRILEIVIFNNDYEGEIDQKRYVMVLSSKASFLDEIKIFVYRNIRRLLDQLEMINVI